MGEQINWAVLEHNYGTAEDVPELLRRCAGPDGEEAADELHNLLFHQGGWICPAASAALPYLLRLAADSDVPGRLTILELIAMLAGEAGRVAERFLDPAWPPAWDRALPGVLALLAAPEPEIRRAAADVIGACATPGAALLPTLLNSWRTETDLPTRLELTLALGKATRRTPTGDHHAEAETLLREQLDAPHPQLRLAALHALAPVAPDHLPQALEAVRDPSVDLWRQTSSIAAGPRAVQHWTADLFPGASPVYALGLLADHPDDEQRIGALAQAGDLLAQWRSPTTALLPEIARRLDDPATEVRYRAVELLACLGPTATAYADEVALLLDDTGVRTTRTAETVAGAAVWALARMNDPRCLPALTECVTGTRAGLTWGGGLHFSGRPHRPVLPSLQEVLTRLPDHADRLLPALTTRLATAKDPRGLCDVLAAWGAAAHPAIPHLLPLLHDDQRWTPAATALAAMGEAAHEASARLLLRTRTPGDPELAAWAYWKTSGDPTPLLETTEAPSVRRLADLGPHAAPFADRFRTLTTDIDPWTRVNAAHALWSATGDTDHTIPVLTAEIRDLPNGTYVPVMLAAVRHLTRMGHAPRFLDTVPTTDHRLHYFSGWRSFTEDETIRTAVTELLAEGPC
ncbi:HEAT repeat domain-containing protein [Streptomyces acidiscabies]|uniref:HEAT repeat domain-containing protein n=1 Tax=Streptomyces acidiscabies TaxID=42234 RepID=A0AAP6BJF4_9ACTN|nr:HEAT repeat domain-containing protein [Streptomyces acidiscabies]MBZ3913978.1 HEAT repeat domain-containing protein [Streptomyces acidiscabies]MDX2965863.1 HEAT repeat domain-containing protein [Streptomyces acidiscabies]MDX3025309.1 HEAT repeat domain-containing protein [Streptomyces acidiscabies]MDX3795699.1 HEAT repeat domain-containing protein [Streptomyces acidiscabies]GAQ57029.1 hypothetical protein a10_06894 [Streptomyces acidiscabies]